jgi:AAA+ ATPase superfamily predicted ATPase
MAEKIIGRTDELDLMLKIAKSEEAELLTVFGRRRLGRHF